jgi:16S rRNA (guanine966-N2)-methyltransferase
MRVIAGLYRSRPLQAPRGLATRPTSDRLRETLFNVIAVRVPGARFADLYAGSGAVGIEAISRGAAEVHFAEKSTAAVTAIRANLRTLGIGSDFSIEVTGTAALLKQLAGKPLDLVFLDPPYDAAEEYRKTLTLLGAAENELLADDALVIVEHTRKHPLLDRYGNLERTRTILQGDAALSFYSITSLEPDVPATLA